MNTLITHFQIIFNQIAETSIFQVPSDILLKFMNIISKKLFLDIQISQSSSIITLIIVHRYNITSSIQLKEISL